jgi:hypothetical protein
MPILRRKPQRFSYVLGATLRYAASILGAIACGACAPDAVRSDEPFAGTALRIEVLAPDGAPCSHAEIYVCERVEEGLRWSVDWADGAGLCVRHSRWHPFLPERVAAWHPAHGLSQIVPVRSDVHVRLVLDRPLHAVEGRCLTRAGHAPGRIAVGVDARRSDSAKLPRIEELAEQDAPALALVGYAPRATLGTEALEEALRLGFEDGVVASAEDGRFRCAGMRRPAPRLLAHVTPLLERGADEPPFAALEPDRAEKGADGIATWILPWERVRWEIVATEKTHVEDAGTWAVRDARSGERVWIGRGEQQELWTSSRELRLFYARRPWTYVDETIALDGAPAELLRFQPLSQERLARVDLRTSALTVEVDLRYPVLGEWISLREEQGLLRMGGGEALWVFPAAARLAVTLDPMSERWHSCSSSWRWLDVEQQIDPLPGTTTTIELAEREGARVRLDLDTLREPRRRLEGLTIDGRTPTWLYVDRRGQVRELAQSTHRHGRVFSCELWEPGPVVLRRVEDRWRMEVVLEPGVNDVRIE